MFVNYNGLFIYIDHEYLTLLQFIKMPSSDKNIWHVKLGQFFGLKIYLSSCIMRDSIILYYHVQIA